MGPLVTAILRGCIAGVAIPLGGLAAWAMHVKDRELREEIFVFLAALGGGALLGAVALVLLPEGMRGHGPAWVGGIFVAGAATFLALDAAIERVEGNLGQSLALVIDGVPESLAIGATAPAGGLGLVLAILVALQNLPEGFNAFREIRATRRRAWTAMGALGGIALLNPLGAWIGFAFLLGHPALLSATMLFAAGGIVYLLFRDVAPLASRKGHWIPTFGAVIGVAVSLVGVALGARSG